MMVIVYYKLFEILNILHAGTHISLWMSSEADEHTVPSVAEHIGQHGLFLVTHYHFKKNGSTILLTANGKFLL